MTGSTTCVGPVERDSGSDSVSPRKDDERAGEALHRVADVVALYKSAGRVGGWRGWNFAASRLVYLRTERT